MIIVTNLFRPESPFCRHWLRVPLLLMPGSLLELTPVLYPVSLPHKVATLSPHIPEKTRPRQLASGTQDHLDMRHDPFAPGHLRR